MNDLVDLQAIRPLEVWTNVRARRVQGSQLTFAVVELGPDSVVPEHRHPNEQIGMVIKGRVRFAVGDELRDLGPGGTWRILGDVPHSVTAGPSGAVVIDVFSPIRSDWNALNDSDPVTPNWPDPTV
jgi:quercetin dioxygenase-like cupin family protein